MRSPSSMTALGDRQTRGKLLRGQRWSVHHDSFNSSPGKQSFRMEDIIRFILGNFTLTFFAGRPDCLYRCDYAFGKGAYGASPGRGAVLLFPVVLNWFQLSVQLRPSRLLRRDDCALHRMAGQSVSGRGRIRQLGFRGSRISRLPPQLRNEARRGGWSGILPVRCGWWPRLSDDHRAQFRARKRRGRSSTPIS